MIIEVFSPGTSVSSSNKSEIMLKVALNTITLIRSCQIWLSQLIWIWFPFKGFFFSFQPKFVSCW
jgi:hypothetical protein